MNAPKTGKDTCAPGQARCLVRSVASALAQEPGLEAVTIDRSGRSISVATLGRVAASDLGGRIAATVEEAQRAPEAERCCLLAGEADCQSCPIPGEPVERRGLTVRQEADRTTIARVTCPTAPRFWRWQQIPWPKIVPREVEIPEDEAHLEEWKPQLLAALLCGLFGLIGYFHGSHDGFDVLPYSLAYLFGVWFQLEEIWERLQRRSLDVHFLMITVAAGSAAIGAWAEGATLLFLFSLSGALEHYAMGRTQREIRSLFRAAPKAAARLDTDGREHATPVEALRPGHRLLLRPGEQFPVDAEIVKGKTASDESNLTGEATPVEKGVGDLVLAGTLNLWGVVEAIVLRPVQESALQKIIRLIREAQHLKAPSQRFTDRFGSGYTYAILGLTVAMFAVWWAGFHLPPFRSTPAVKSAFYQAMTLLVVASPCALVLSIPSAVLAAIAWGARRGILFRGGAAVEKLAEVDVVALDKTGTLTTGELEVERVESFPPGRESEVGQLAFSLERLSSHPLARAITRYGKRRGLAPVEFAHFESRSGLGLEGRLGDRLVFLGRREWLASLRPASTGSQACAARLEELPQPGAGHSEVWLATGDLLGRVLLRDAIRPEAGAVVAELRRMGVHAVVLTGDRPSAADVLRETLGLTDVRAELKPEQKVAAIQAFSQAGRRVAMVGDGVNDAPSLAAAHVGVAMGARGSDAALEQADVVLMHDRLENFSAAYWLSQRARLVIRTNLVISLGTVAVLVGLALLGLIPLTVGVVGHEGSTVVVVLNSLRLLFGRTPSVSQTASASPGGGYA
jgi:Cd2+/Zn2+-exporting ATPase